MSNHQDASYFLDLIHTGRYPELFELLEQQHLPKLSGSQRTIYHNFKAEFIHGTNDIRYSQRLSAFITGEVFQATNNQGSSSNPASQNENTAPEKSKKRPKIVFTISIALGMVLIYKVSGFFKSNSQKSPVIVNKEKAIKLRGNVSKEDGRPAVGAKAEIIGRTWLDYVGDDGNFSLKLNGKGEQQFTLRITYKTYPVHTKKVKVNFDDPAVFQDLPPIRLKKPIGTNTNTGNKGYHNTDNGRLTNTQITDPSKPQKFTLKGYNKNAVGMKIWTEIHGKKIFANIDELGNISLTMKAIRDEEFTVYFEKDGNVVTNNFPVTNLTKITVPSIFN